jgi:hypothetical protein
MFETGAAVPDYIYMLELYVYNNSNGKLPVVGYVKFSYFTEIKGTGIEKLKNERIFVW